MLPRAVLVFLISVGCLFSATARAEEPVQATRESDLYVTRVFTLRGIELRDAMMLVRRANDLRKVVMIRERDAMVVSDTAAKVAQAEELFKGKGVLVGAAEPYAPLYLEKLARSPAETRVFQVESDSMKTAVSVLRIIYDVRELKSSEEDHTLQISAAPLILASGEALLRELRLLSEPAKP